MLIGDIIRRLLAKYFLLVTGTIETEVCGNINLCTNLVYGIEGTIHATLAEYVRV